VTGEEQGGGLQGGAPAVPYPSSRASAALPSCLATCQGPAACSTITNDYSKDNFRKYIWWLHLPDIGQAGVELPPGACTLDELDFVAAEEGGGGGGVVRECVGGG
jgi:hypothetical protein